MSQVEKNYLPATDIAKEAVMEAQRYKNLLDEIERNRAELCDLSRLGMQTPNIQMTLLDARKALHASDLYRTKLHLISNPGGEPLGSPRVRSN